MAAFLIHVVIKSSLALIVTWMAACALRHRSAASRHLVWTLGLLSTLALPVLEAVGPAWDLPVPVAQFNVEGVVAPAAPERAAAVSGAPADRRPVGMPANRREPMALPLRFALTWSSALIDLWLLGALLALTQLAAGMIAIRARVSRAVVVADPSWRADINLAASAVGTTGGVSLRMAEGTTIPLVCGLWRPTILLPVEGQRWSDERRRVVLVHELAHVARRDCAVLAVARFARALYWFNPLAHLAAARLRIEQERAADDMVIAAGTEASAYAEHLLDIARACRTAKAFEGLAVAMARPSEIEGRLMAILDDRRNRIPLSRAMRVGVGVTVAAVLVPLAAVRVTAANVADVRLPAARAIDVAPPLWPDKTALAAPRVEAGARRAEPVQAAAQRGAAVPGTPPAPGQTPGPAPVPAPPTPGVRVDVPFGTSPVDAETRRRVADALIVALDDSNERVRAQALSTLASMHDERVIPGLVKALSDASVDMRDRAIEGLQQFDTPDTTAALAKALNDSSPDVREHAATALGSIRNARSVGPLVQALKDANASVRRRAAWALGMLAEPAAIDGLTLALKDADPAVREQAARSLGSIARGRPLGASRSASFSIDVSEIREVAAQASRDAARVVDEKRRELQSLRDRLVVPPAPPAPPEPPPIPSVR